MQRRRRVGVLGGMFDPVHLGHLQAATLSRECCDLDDVLLVPCGQPVHRAATLTPADQRCAMLELAIADQPWLHVDRRECDSAGPSWTFTTLTALKDEQPDIVLYWILGMDAFLSLPSWYRWRELFELAHFIVIRRPDAGAAAPEPGDELAAACAGRWVLEQHKVPDAVAGSVFVVPQASRALSSTQVREALQQGKPVDGLLPPAVAAYIRTQHLYQ